VRLTVGALPDTVRAFFKDVDSQLAAVRADVLDLRTDMSKLATRAEMTSTLDELPRGLQTEIRASHDKMIAHLDRIREDLSREIAALKSDRV